MNIISKSLILAVLVVGGNGYSQNQTVPPSSAKGFHPKTFINKPATIKGTTAEITFGALPTVEIQRDIDTNIPITFENNKYYYNEGDLFIYNGGRYILIAPPVGLSISSMPDDGNKLEQVGTDLYYKNGIFYKKLDGRYEVVKEQPGAIIYNLPPNTDVVTIGDKAYYEYLGVLYEKVLVNREEAFEVVGELTE
jgi:hypothetical protein